MVQVVSRFLDGHILEQFAICSKDIICPGPDLLYIPPHNPHAPVLKPRLTPWEEVQAHVLYPRCRYLVRDGLTPWSASRICKICIEVTCHQELGPVKSSPYGSRNILYGLGVDGGDIAPHAIPLPPPRHQLKADDVQAVEAKLFGRKVLRIVVKN